MKSKEKAIMSEDTRHTFEALICFDIREQGRATVRAKDQAHAEELLGLQFGHQRNFEIIDIYPINPLIPIIGALEDRSAQEIEQAQEQEAAERLAAMRAELVAGASIENATEANVGQ
jgi:hypothetical protein